MLSQLGQQGGVPVTDRACGWGHETSREWPMPLASPIQIETHEPVEILRQAGRIVLDVAVTGRQDRAGAGQ